MTSSSAEGHWGQHDHAARGRYERAHPGMGPIYAMGQNNFLFDPTQTPHLSANQLSELVGVPESAKARRPSDRDAVRLDAPMDPEFCRAELLADHPLAGSSGQRADR